MAVLPLPGRADSGSPFRIAYRERPLEGRMVARLLDDLCKDLMDRRGRYYARWVLGRWKDHLERHGAWVAEPPEGETRPAGFLGVRQPSPGKGEMALLYATSPAAECALVEEAFRGFAGAGLDLITTTFQSWDRPLERELVQVGQLLDRLGFRSFDVCVLECTPASLLSGAEPPFPAGYRHRPLLSADIPACAELMSASPDLLMEEVRYPAPECEEILRASAGPSGHFSGDLAGVALAPDGRVAGFATANSTGVIGQLYVRAPHRGLGIGRALLDRTLRAIARRGIERAILTAIHGNTAALALYGRAGFAEIYRYPLFFRYLKR